MILNCNTTPPTRHIFKKPIKVELEKPKLALPAPEPVVKVNTDIVFNNGQGAALQTVLCYICHVKVDPERVAFLRVNNKNFDEMSCLSCKIELEKKTTQRITYEAMARFNVSKLAREAQEHEEKLARQAETYLESRR